MKETSGLNNSFIPMLSECERFVEFLDKRFNLNLPPYVITINKAKKSAIGHFMGDKHKDKFINEKSDLNNINLNTLYLKTSSPFECLTHEVAHFINYSKNIKDCSSNQYHNKYFKQEAEGLLLKVERTKKGYSNTSETEEFKEMLKEFKPLDVFNIIQEVGNKVKVGSRLKLWLCSCGVKVRCAVDLNAKCLNCDGVFKNVE